MSTETIKLIRDGGLKYFFWGGASNICTPQYSLVGSFLPVKCIGL